MNATERNRPSTRLQLQEWLPLIRAEFDELPDLQFTQAEVQNAGRFTFGLRRRYSARSSPQVS
jgi:hypothetical protein